LSRRFTIAIVTGVAAIALLVGATMALLSGERIYPGIRVGGADLSNMTIDQAERRMALLAVDVTAQKVTLRYANESMPATLADLGGAVDIEASVKSAYQVGRRGNVVHRIVEVLGARRRPVDLEVVYEFGEETASEFLREVAKKINREPVNATPVVEDGDIFIRPEKPGISLNPEKSLARIAQAVNSGKREVKLVAETAQPRIKASDLRGIDGVIGSYSTPYNSWERDRTYNLKLACQAMNGTLLKPGEVFSYNKVVGPRDKKYGFRDAKMFVEGRIESGTGGGVCQVSTTVYNAALLANLEIVKRSHHSRPVVYAPIGRDATVAPTIDFKFRNNTDTPVYITASVGARTVNVTIYGRKHEGRSVEIVSLNHSTVGPKTVERVDEALAPDSRVVKQSGRSGHRISIYRIVKEHGKEVSRELISRDYYAPENRIVAVSKPVQM